MGQSAGIPRDYRHLCDPSERNSKGNEFTDFDVPLPVEMPDDIPSPSH